MTAKTRIKKIEQARGSKKEKPVYNNVVVIYDPAKLLPKANDTGATIFIPDNFRDKVTA
jgi:hypothetical protein